MPARTVTAMPVPLNTVVRSLGYAWIGVVMFGLYPPTAHHALTVQVIAYLAAGLGVAAWSLVEHYPPAARRAWLLPAATGVIAAASGCAAGSGYGGLALLVLGFFATMTAADCDLDLMPALAVPLGGILASEITVLAYGAGYGGYIGFPVAFTSAFFIGRSISRTRAALRMQAEQAVQLLAQREQTEAERRRADLLDERARVAREIHDVLAHSLGALGIQVQAARSVLTDRGDIAKADEMLAAAQKMAAEGLIETRRALHALRTDTRPLDEELAKATATYAERYRVTASVHTEGAPRPVPPDATVALLRIAQEAMVNAAKHATGQPVRVRLAYDPAEVRLTVSNELTAQPTGHAETSRPGNATGETVVSTANTGYGLTGMRERLRLLNGSVESGRRDSQWVVTAQVPVPAP
jgi:signal transduction histidine kinase